MSLTGDNGLSDLLFQQVDLLMSFRSATFFPVWQYIPVAFLFVPLTLAGYVGLAPEKTNAAAGLMNFFRNMWQSVGTSTVTTLIARRSQYHQSVLAEYTASGRFHSSITALATRLTRSGLSARRSPTSIGPTVRTGSVPSGSSLPRGHILATGNELG
jgi:MFS transporter, DHA2 family, multidrug resistance protein